MKKIILIVTFTLVGKCFAQGNLQFNQVINMTFASTNTTPVSVPAGKVWKLESCMLNSTGNSYAYMQYNGTLYNMRQQQTSTQVVNFPFWLASGASVIFGAGGAAGGVLSIIEFNVVP